MSENRNQTNLIALLDPKHPISEAYRTLRSNIQFTNVDKELRTIMVTSSGPAEGKTTTIANLAIVLAQTEKKVILIDADLRKPSIHRKFQLPNRLGLTNTITGTHDLDQTVNEGPISTLNILTSGPIPPNPAELLGSTKMQEIIKKLSLRYDYVLIDTPPVLAVTDAQILAQFTDGVLLVLKSGQTHRDMAIKAKEQLKNVKANIIGAVLNQQNTKEKGYYYYYYGNK